MYIYVSVLLLPLPLVCLLGMADVDYSTLYNRDGSALFSSSCYYS